MDEEKLFGHSLSEIRNIQEELVMEVMGQILDEEQSICRCQLCVEDIYALSLNKLPPVYVQSTFKERTFKNYDLTKILDRELVEKTIREAIGTVSRNPYH